MNRFAIVCLLFGLTYGQSIYWACNEQSVTSQNPCFGLIQYTDGKVSQIPLQSQGFDLLNGFAADSPNGIGYFLLGDSAFDPLHFPVAKVSLTTGDIVSYSETNVTLLPKDVVLDVHYDSESSLLYTFVNNLGDYDLYTINVKTGVKTHLVQVYTNYEVTYFFGSVFNSGLFTTVLVTCEGTMYSLQVNVSTNNIVTYRPGYNLQALATYNASANTLIGNQFSWPEQENQFVFYDVYGNYTYGNIYGAGQFCGESPHSLYDPTTQIYYAICCTNDLDGCLNATISEFNVQSGELVSQTPLFFEQRPKYGLDM